MSLRSEAISKRITHLKKLRSSYLEEYADPRISPARRGELALVLTHISMHIDDLVTYC